MEGPTVPATVTHRANLVILKHSREFCKAHKILIYLMENSIFFRVLNNFEKQKCAFSAFPLSKTNFPVES